MDPRIHCWHQRVWGRRGVPTSPSVDGRGTWLGEPPGSICVQVPPCNPAVNGRSTAIVTRAKVPAAPAARGTCYSRSRERPPPQFRRGRREGLPRGDPESPRRNRPRTLAGALTGQQPR